MVAEYARRLLRTVFFPLLCAPFITVLSGCAGIDVQRYQDQTPALNLRQYFNGELQGHGLFMDRHGVVQRRFVVSIKASWQGDVGTLIEDFVWSDGEKEQRVWTLKPAADQPGEWIGTASDVVGEARGRIAGNTLNWRYTYRLKTKDGSSYDLQFDDWMHLIDQQVLLNRAAMSFWGWPVGEVLISFTRLPATKP